MGKDKNRDFAMKEFDLAFKEFFKDKKQPKNDLEEKSQMEGFMNWYNNVRKQSDTGKTPSQMHKEIYGKEPPKKHAEGYQKPSRVMNFEWDADYKEPHELFAEADDLIIEGEYGKALIRANEIIDIVGEEEDEVLMMKAEILNNLKRYDESEQCLKKLKNYGNKTYADFYRSQRAFQQANFVRALKFMNKSFEQDPNNFDFIIGMANDLYLNGDSGYNSYFEKAKQLDEKRAKNFRKKFWIEPKELMQGSFLPSALTAIDKLIEENNSNEARENIHFLLIHQKYLPNDIIDMLFGLEIECFFMESQIEEVEIKIENLIKRNPKNPHAYFYKAQLLYNNSNFEEALIFIDKCLYIAEKKIPHPDFYLLKGMILKELDDESYIYYENKGNELRKGIGNLPDMIKDMLNEDDGR